MVRPKTILSRSELEAASEFAARAGLSLEQWLYALASVPDRNAGAPPSPEPQREAPRHTGDPFARSRFFSDPPRYPEQRFSDPRYHDPRAQEARYPDPRATEASFVAETRGLLEASEQRTADALAKLLGWIETSSSRTEGEIGRIADTCGKISDSVRSSLDVINQRLSTVEHTVKTGGGSAIPELLQKIEMRIGQLEHARRPGVDPAELSEAFSEFEQRLDGIARYMETTQRTSTSQSERLNVIETALALALKRMEAAADPAQEQARARQQQTAAHEAKRAALAAREEERSRELQEVHAAIQQLQGSINVAVPKINAAAESVLSSVASAIPQEFYAVSHRLDAVDRQLGSLGNKVDPLTAGLNAEIPSIKAELAKIAAAMQPDLQAKLEALEESVNSIIDSFRRVDDSYRESRTANDSIVELIGRIGEIQTSVDDITARLPGNIGTLLELAKKGTSQANVVESLDRLHDRMADLSAEQAAPKEVLRRLDRLENAIRTTGLNSIVEDATTKVAANLNDQIADTIKSVFDTFERNTKCDTILNSINSRLTEVLQSPDLAKAKPQPAVAAAAVAAQAAVPQSAPVQPAPAVPPAPRDDEASRLARALKAAERARDEVPPEPRAPKAPQPDDYAARLAQVTGGAYRPQPALRAAAASADLSARRTAPLPEAAPGTQVLRDPPAPDSLRPHNQVPPAPPPATDVEKEPVKNGRRGKLPIAAASVVALMAGLGWAATSKYGDSPQLAAMLDRLRSLDHVDEVLALFQPTDARPAKEQAAVPPPPVTVAPATLDLPAQDAASPAQAANASRDWETREGKSHVVIDAAPVVPLPPVPVRAKAEPERAPFPPTVSVSPGRGDTEGEQPAQARPDVEAAVAPVPDPDGLERIREEKASVTGSIEAAAGTALGTSSAAVPKCPDYEAAIISTGVTRCAPERPTVTPERRTEVSPPAAPEKKRVASIAAAPVPAPAGRPLLQKPTLTAVEKAFFSKPLQEALLSEDPVAAYDAGMRLLLGKAVPRDSKAAARWLQIAADEGLAPAQYELGSIYELGTGVPKDIPLAMEWYGKAARGGNVKAMHNLGALLSDASAGTPDMAGAAHWFRKAAEYGVRESQYNMGFLCVRGVGVPQDLTEAYLWFSLAAAQGDTNALKKKQMVTGLLDEDSLAKAKNKVDMFQGSIPDLAANTVDLTGRNWSVKKKVIGS